MISGEIGVLLIRLLEVKLGDNPLDGIQFFQFDWQRLAMLISIQAIVYFSFVPIKCTEEKMLPLKLPLEYFYEFIHVS